MLHSEFDHDSNYCMYCGGHPQEYQRIFSTGRGTWTTHRPGSAELHGYTCGWCEWGRDRVYYEHEYINHMDATGHYGKLKKMELEDNTPYYQHNDDVNNLYYLSQSFDALSRLPKRMIEEGVIVNLGAAITLISERIFEYERKR